MRIGIHLPHIGRKAGPEAIRRAAIQAEELGFADVWSSEHIIIPKGAPYPPSAIFYDPVLTLTWAAAFTKKIICGRPAPAKDVEFSFGEVVRCSHMSGPLMRYI